MRFFIIAAMSAATATGALAAADVPPGALEAASHYSRDVMAADCGALAPLSGILARHAEARDDLCETYRAWKADGQIERLRDSTESLASGDDRLVVVPNSRIIDLDGRPTITNGVYVVYSKDAGHTWKVIDIGCERLKDWIKSVYPAYDGRPTFRTTVDHPMASR